jgi:hypothetical protein
VNDVSRAKVDSLVLRSSLCVSEARFILVALICASPAILLWDGLVTQGIFAGVVAASLAITAPTLRPGETEFLISTVRPVAAMAAVPALWMLIQAVPLGILAHPIWRSAESALGRPVAGSISIDPGATVIAFGQYLSLTAVVLVSAAIAVDRHRAEWILFALTGAVAAIAILLLGQELFYSSGGLTSFPQEAAVDCAAVGTIIASSACVRTIERYETRRANSQRSVPTLLLTLVASGAALVICFAALFVNGAREALIAAGCGIAAFACMMIIRRFGAWYAAVIVASILSVIVFAIATHPADHVKSVLLAFASPPTVATEHVLGDAPAAGTGAGTFAALARIYREMDDPLPQAVASTTAASYAIELGRPMLWLIALATAGSVIILLRASLQRRRDSFYPAMGGSCLITQLLLAFVNAGLLTTAVGLVTAAALGLAFAQSKSRTVVGQQQP